MKVQHNIIIEIDSKKIVVKYWRKLSPVSGSVFFCLFVCFPIREDCIDSESENKLNRKSTENETIKITNNEK